MKTNKILTATKISRTDRALHGISRLLTAFESGQAFHWIGNSIIKTNCPSDSWSLTNYLIMISHDTKDARGFRQWQKVGRRIKKGAKAIWINAPRTLQHNVTDSIDELEENTVQPFLVTGFYTIPVFRYEDTIGSQLYRPPPFLPDLKSVADVWGITVDYLPLGKNVLGYYKKTGEIKLNSNDPEVFYHELAHAAQDKLGILNQDKALSEISAEACALGLCSIYGGSTPKTNQNIGAYIQHYATKIEKRPEHVLLSVLSDCEAILNLINETAEQAGVEIDDPVLKAA